MKSFKALAAAIVLVATASVSLAGTYAGTCTTEPQANWIKSDAIVQKARDAGYSVSKSKVAGSCYEVYATKDSKRFELFFNPMTADLVHTVAK